MTVTPYMEVWSELVCLQERLNKIAQISLKQAAYVDGDWASAVSRVHVGQSAYRCTEAECTYQANCYGCRPPAPT